MMSSSVLAVQHLKKIKPLDGWSVEAKRSNLRLLRRSVPLTDNYFLDIHHDKGSGSVVGILSHKDGQSQAQVLVDRNGKVVSNNSKSLVSITTYDPSSRVAKSSASATSRAASTRTGTTEAEPLLTDEQNKLLFKYGGGAILGLIVIKALTNAMSGALIFLLPLAYLYLVQTCPTEVSFDAKKELKRVLRGHHLPEDHPEKPKGFLSETFARINAAVTTELATGLGYEVTMVPLAGAVIVSCVRVPSVSMDCYWVGAAGKWWYVYSSEYAQ